VQPLALAMILSVARVSEWVSAVEAGRRRVFTRTGPPVRGALVASRPMSRGQVFGPTGIWVAE
jgi:hypothetical protein